MIWTPEVIGAAVHWVVLALLGVAGLFFVWQFCVPAWRVHSSLHGAIKALTRLKSSGAPALDLDMIERVAMKSSALQHCWSEFRDTLHPQKQANAQGVMEVTRWRQTALSSVYFSEQALVEAPLRVEFYKHLPGILTGLGIIGTFTGLILGLNGFEVSDDAGRVRSGLKSLLDSVGSAFVVSGSAIALAMLVTTIEKLVINGRYTQVERLCGLIDSLFDAGAGEEYLQRLVEASETSATQALQMKESLVTDLKQVLSELTQQQIATMNTNSLQLGSAITSSISEGLKEPLAKISDAVQSVSGQQGEAVNKLLTDVLAGFMSQMEGMFGQQMRSVNEMLAQTAGTIQEASKRFETLAGQIQQAGTGAVEGMARRMDESLQQMQARQAEANVQMREFIDQLKKSVAAGQAESAELTLGMMRELGESTNALLKSMQEQGRQAADDQARQQAKQMGDMGDLMARTTQSVQETSQRFEELAAKIQEAGSGAVQDMGHRLEASLQKAQDREAAAQQEMRDFVERLQGQVRDGHAQTAEATQVMLHSLGEGTHALLKALQEQNEAAGHEQSRRQAKMAAEANELLSEQTQLVKELLEANRQASASTQQVIVALKAAADEHIARMGAGAERLYQGSTALGDKLQDMRAATSDMSSALTGLNAAGAVLNQTLSATQQALGDQKVVRDTLADMVRNLRETVEAAKREGALTTQLVNQLHEAGQTLAGASQQADEYLDAVTRVLGEAHAEFGKHMETTLREGNRAFHQELAQATDYLRSAISDLGDALDNIPQPA